MGNTIRAVLIAAFLLLGGTACFSKPEAGEVGVQRGGGPIEGKAFKDIICPGAGTKTTWNDSVHYYPHSGVQRYFRIGQGEGDLRVPVRVQTSDGFFVTIKGTLFFNTTFDCSAPGKESVEAFDRAYGVRKFAEPGGSDADGKFPYEGDRGWIAFLDTAVRPIIENELARTMQDFRCRELISSCSLVTGDASQPSETGETRIDYTAIQSALERGMEEETRSTLGRQYLTGWRFRMLQPTLEPEVQQAINRSQAAYANVSVQRAARDAAVQQRRAAEELAAVYERSPALAQIEMLRILCGTNAALAQTQRNAQDSPGCNGANVYLGVDPVVTIPAGTGAGARP